ncbi:3-hydroxyacyl-CoA dehydrogenase family protein [Gordonia shandongensis]|uniref:3-hydroxyacyl-CoA dehydrogenase family protein n=1 Tax=Gordonia shandongensis TaxID=376351 RepID=UPI000426ED2E|nr:3-hydroxyacyl-CoA dehydrogenase family protein [Gordonia shandongensis]
MSTATPHPQFAADLAEVRSGAARPAAPEYVPRRLGVVGAGMMGAGIAYAAAAHGIDVVLVDTTAERAADGRRYSEKVLGRRVDRGAVTRQEAATILDRIRASGDYAELSGCDGVIEAVFEDPTLKADVFGRIQTAAPDAFLASNTSTLPISDLAAATADPATFIGMHFFSPVDRMELLEIVVGAESSDHATAKAFDLGAALGKTPIVVNDARGFFTSRVITKYLDEAMAMVAEGVGVERVERAALAVGYPVGPLQLVDETSIALARTVRDENRAAAGDAWTRYGSDDVLDRMVAEFSRPGRAARGGFYDYDDAGRRVGVWSGIAEHFGADSSMADDDVRDRLLFSEAVDTLRCFAEGVLRSPAEANVGSVLGIGFPVAIGGTARLVSDHPGGVDGFLARADELRSRYGDRFAVPAGSSEIVGEWS